MVVISRIRAVRSETAHKKRLVHLYVGIRAREVSSQNPLVNSYHRYLEDFRRKQHIITRSPVVAVCLRLRRRRTSTTHHDIRSLLHIMICVSSLSQ